ncbi:NAD(P)H-quinone oxidoreductase [Gordonia soli]|uniref:Putative oxidoreductase n=1 Tax=Gordonia soli NBRC 108243 TaxID=1223545 RepID=M0QH03_9ACTN|nr:NAD(P)H-quinone oxidoreductase [Gordonia soli]GAC67719.1 putative oxidoreductase [Gordonia soli NBRC 108243]
MRAVSGSESLSVTTVPDPTTGPGEVIIDVAAAGVNRADLMQRQGKYPPPPGASDILGLEVSGRIAEIGAEVTGWSVGDEVCALLAGGGYAERVAVPAPQVLPVPAGVDLVSAAALPEVACTVMSNVILTGGLAAGDLFLVHGGSSGIGTHAIQVAHAIGARVATTARTEAKRDRCRELGADIVIDYTAEDFADIVTAEGGAEVILDLLGAKYLERNVDALGTGGRLVIIGMQGGIKAELNIAKLLTKRAAVFGTTLRARPVDGPDGKGEIVAATHRHTWPLIESGQVMPIVDRVFSLDDVEAAHAHLDGGDAIGKVLLSVGADTDRDG